MTREEIIKALEDGITSWGMYNVNWDAMGAIEADAEPFTYVKPILDLIAAHYDIDFGAPGELVHFVEKFSNQGYEELLIESVKKSPTPHNIWMVHRCYNDCDSIMYEKIVNLIHDLREDSSISDIVKNVINEYDW